MNEQSASPEQLINASPAQQAEHTIIRFLKSRLPGEKTARNMKQIDSLVSHLPENTQELTATIRPVIKAGMYAGNVVGTYMEAMLAASVGLGVVVIAKEGLRMIPVSPGSTEMKRKGLGGVWKDLNVGSIPKSLINAIGLRHTDTSKVDLTEAALTLYQTIVERNRAKQSTAESLQIFNDALRKNPKLFETDLPIHILSDIIHGPFKVRKDGSRGIDTAVNIVTDKFFIDNPDAPETKELIRAYTTFSETVPGLQKNACIRFLDQFYYLFAYLKHSTTYAKPLLNVLTSRATSLMKEHMNQEDRKKVSQAVQLFDAIGNATHAWPIDQDPSLWEISYHELTRYPETPFR